MPDAYQTPSFYLMSRITSSLVALSIVLFFTTMGCDPSPAANSKPVETDTSPYNHIEDERARALIAAAIEHAGGLERWNSIRELTYRKYFDLLFEGGEVERTFRQQHHYAYDPIAIRIHSVENGDTIITTQSDKGFGRTVNGDPIETAPASLAKSINTSLYVVGIPFKLLDPGPKITYLGVDTLFDGRKAEVVEFRYDAEANANHSTSDVWRYYFATDRPEIIANWVDAGDHYSLIDNETFVRAGGLLWPEKRKSYRIDSMGNLLYLRADYQYGEYEVAYTTD